MIFNTPLACLLALPFALASPVRPAHHRRDGADPGMPYDKATTPYCTFWVDNDGSLTCQDTLDFLQLSIDDFRRWNPSITAGCGNFKLNQSYCVDASKEPKTTTVTTSSSTTAPVHTSTPTTTSTTTTATTTKPDNGIATPTPTQPGMVDNCNSFYFVKKGDTCDSIASSHGISVQDFEKWNSHVGAQCSGLWSDVNACVGVVGFVGSPTKPSNSIQTPSPTQADIIDICSKFYFVQQGETCADVAAKNGITAADLAAWNRKIGSDCAGLYAQANACVGVIQRFDFGDGTNQRWMPVDGSFDTSSNALVAKPGGAKAATDAPLNDFLFKAHVTLASSSGNAGVLIRASSLGKGSDAYRGYYVGISAEGDGFVVMGRADNNWNELKRVTAKFSPGQVHTIKVLALKDQISVFVDDMGFPKFTVTDGTYRTGVVGVRTYSTGATFDDMEVYPIVYENFDQNMVGWKISDGGFDSRTGEMVTTNVASGKAIYDPMFTNFIFDGDLTVAKNSGGNAGFLFRTTSAGQGSDSYHGYYAGLSTSGQVILGKSDGRWTQLKTVNMAVSAEHKYHIQIKAVGDAIDVYVEDMGNPKISVKDSQFGFGHVGVKLFNAAARADNLQIRPL